MSRRLRTFAQRHAWSRRPLVTVALLILPVVFIVHVIVEGLKENWPDLVSEFKAGWYIVRHNRWPE